MKRLQETKPIWHAVIWIFIYIGLNSIGDTLSDTIGIYKSATCVLLVLLTAFLVIYVKKNHWVEYYGLVMPNRQAAKTALYYIPLIIIIPINFLSGFSLKYSLIETFLFLLMMLCVGFIEELIFRGFLLKAIAEKNLKRAIIISSITFGIGHIVNLFMGAGTIDTFFQMLYAVALGFALTMLVITTKSIIPGIVFHSILNALSVVGTIELSQRTEGILTIYVIVVSAIYTFVLILYGIKERKTYMHLE